MLVATPVLVATCVGPCHQDTPAVAVTHRLGEPVAITLGDASLGTAVAPGEMTSFALLGDGRPLPTLALQRGDDDPIVFDLDTIVTRLQPSDCVVVLVEPCAPGSPDACATRLETGERGGYSFECRAPLRTAMDSAAVPSETDDGATGSSDGSGTD